MKYYIAILFCINLMTSVAQPSGNSHVVTHDHLTITTDPSQGVNCYTGWGIFPDKTTGIRKIILHLTLGSPDTLPTAHWDYLDIIRLKRSGGIKGKIFDYELGRMLTPYGSIFTKGWKWTWSVDVTDFSLLLHDSVEIEYCHSGYEPATVGWSLTIDFEIVKGAEVLKPVSITPLWTGSFRYGDKNDDIEEKLSPITITTGKETAISRLRIQHTGHGMDTTRGCSEFCSRWREVTFDGEIKDHTDLWKNCGNNPLYPQGGTWIYDRAAWCPGDLQQPWIYDFETRPGDHTIDINMEPYTASDPQANESIASFMVQYSTPSAKTDVAVEKIIVPNNDPNFNRFNPAIRKPVIIIRNLGSANVNSLQIEYGTRGFKKNTFRWTGDLAFNQADTITLPGIIDFGEGKNRFEVSVKPEGKKDAWQQDNTLSSSFEAPVLLPEKMLLQFLTNNKPNENRITITDHAGEMCFVKEPDSLQPRTMYYDTLNLPNGSYELNLSDQNGDGLEFWYEPESGYGYLRLLTPDGHLLYNFESDCGDGQHLCFTTSTDYVADTATTQYAFSMFPRRTKGLLNLDVHSDKPTPMEIIITADGVVVEKHTYHSVKTGRFVYDFTYLPARRYILEVLADGESKFKRRFNKE